MSKQKQLYIVQRSRALEFLGGRCVDCGAVEKLEFDHLVAADKEYEISTRFGRVRFETLLPELRKCALRCKRCHAVKTVVCKEVPPPVRTSVHGDVAMYMRHKCRCEKCRAGYSAWRREYRRAKGISSGTYNTSPSAHGDVRHYRRGCRCAVCRKANADKQRELRHARVAQRQRQ